MQVVLRSGRTLLHTNVPPAAYESYASDGNSSSYWEQIVANYPPVDPDPFYERDLGPIERAYIDAIKEAPPALLSFCELALQNAIQGADAALREIDRLDIRAAREGDERAGAVSKEMRDAIAQARSAAVEASQRMKRKEYRLAWSRMQKVIPRLDRMVVTLPSMTKQASSVSIREQHQASHYIAGCQRLMGQAEKALQMLCSRVENDEASSAPKTL